jgi:hypothetical protein
MARRGNPLHAAFDAPLRSRSVRRSRASSWRDAMRRGAILASVFAFHLFILVMVLHPSWHRIEQVPQPHEDDVLPLAFDPLPKRPAFLPAPANARIPVKMKSIATAVTSPVAIRQPTITLPATAAPSMAAAPLSSDKARGSYQPGDFQTALQDARQPQAEHIPGTAAPRVAGIRLETRSTIKGAVHVVTEYIRCTDKQLEMENGHDQFSTPQLMDRALQWDDCGPHLGHTAADATVDEISHRAISGD